MSGEDENPDFYEEYEAMNRRLNCTTVSCRDDLNSVISLLHTCVLALSNPEWSSQPNCQKWVSEAIYGFIIPKIEETEERLKRI